MLKLHGRVTKPESYIRVYRKALANAADGLVEAGRRGLTVNARIRFSKEDEKGVQGSYHFRELVKQRAPNEETLFGESYKVFRFNLTDPADMQLWLKHRHGRAWNNAEVHGPGRV